MTMNTSTTSYGMPRVRRASSITGSAVRNLKGDELGKIEDLMMDTASGRIAYVVLAYGGFLGMGGKFFAIPWEALMRRSNDEEYIPDLDEEVLKNAPGFDKDHWPTTVDTTWLSSVYTHYGYTPYWTEEHR